MLSSHSSFRPSVFTARWNKYLREESNGKTPTAFWDDEHPLSIPKKLIARFLLHFEPLHHVIKSHTR